MAWNTNFSLGFCFLNAASTIFVMLVLGLYQGAFEMQYSAYLPSTLANCSSYMPGEPGLMTPIGFQRCFTISRRRMIESLQAAHQQQEIGVRGLGLRHFDREVLGRRVVGRRSR